MSFLDDLIDESTSYKCIEQGTPEWLEMRLGRFTSSEMYKLLQPGKREMTKEELAARPKKGTGSATKLITDYSILADGARTYIEEKVAEVLSCSLEDDTYAFAKEYGKEMEPVAAEYFSKLKGLTIEPAPFIPFGEHAGGSPDRFIVEEDAGLEIKCPLKVYKQVQYLQLTDQWDLMRFSPQMYWQCMSNLLFSERSKWYFATFQPAMKVEKLKMHILEIKPVSEHFDMITKSIAAGVKEKLQLLNLINP